MRPPACSFGPSDQSLTVVDRRRHRLLELQGRDPRFSPDGPQVSKRRPTECLSALQCSACAMVALMTVLAAATPSCSGSADPRVRPALAVPSSHTSVTIPITGDEQADRVERAIALTGEKRLVAGAATEPFNVIIQLAELKSDGKFKAIFQEVAMVHTVAGNITEGIVLYRVGLVAGVPRIVLRGKLNSRIYEVVWESWPDNQRRAGSPAPMLLEFDH